jgi:hypothetical protein
MRRWVALIVGITLLASTPGDARAARPQATVIGDSVLTGVQYNTTPLAVLTNGIDVRLEIGVCRTLAGLSCPYEGGRVPTLLDLVREHGDELGRVVLVELGYNEPLGTFAQDLEDSISALRAAGVEHILWANLSGSDARRLVINALLAAAARAHPELTVIDWHRLSLNKFFYFQNDETHLRYDGAMAMASLFHTAILRALAPPFVVASRSLPAATVGRAYTARLVAHGGIAPYTWRILERPLPRGLRLRPGGVITGEVRRSGRLRIVVQARDATGQTATTSLVLRELS